MRPIQWLGPAALGTGVVVLALAVARGEASVYLVVIVPVVAGPGPLAVLALTILALLAGRVFIRTRSSLGANANLDHGRPRTGGGRHAPKSSRGLRARTRLEGAARCDSLLPCPHRAEPDESYERRSGPRREPQSRRPGRRRRGQHRRDGGDRPADRRRERAHGEHRERRGACGRTHAFLAPAPPGSRSVGEGGEVGEAQA